MVAFAQHAGWTDPFVDQMVREQQMLRSMARRLTRDSLEADDLVQETCFRALRYRGGYVPGSFGIGPWLSAILRNVRSAAARSHSRARQSREELMAQRPAFEKTSDRLGQTFPSGLPELMDHLDARLAKALAQLADHYRTPLLMWAVDGLTYEEIAAELGVPIGTVLSRLSRARDKLGDRLKDLAIERRLLPRRR